MVISRSHRDSDRASGGEEHLGEVDDGQVKTSSLDLPVGPKKMVPIR